MNELKYTIVFIYQPVITAHFIVGTNIIIFVSKSEDAES